MEARTKKKMIATFSGVTKKLPTQLSRCFSSATTIFSSAGYDYSDPFLLENQLSSEEKLVRDSARAFAQQKLLPRVIEASRTETFPREIMKEFGDVGLLGSTVGSEYGGAQVNYVSYGLSAREIEKVDSGYRSAMSVQSSLVIAPIYQFGTEEQKKTYLPGLIKGDIIVSWRLTTCVSLQEEDTSPLFNAHCFLIGMFRAN